MGWVVSSTPRPHFTPGKDPVPIVQEAGWAPGPLRTCAENFAPPPGFDPWTVQSVASRYTDWATPARSPIGSQNCEPCYSKFFVKETVVKLQLHVKRRLSVRYRTRVRLSDVYVRPFTFMSDPSRGYRMESKYIKVVLKTVYFDGKTNISSPLCYHFMQFVHWAYKTNHEYQMHSYLPSCSANVVGLAKLLVASASPAYYKVIRFPL